MNMHLCSCKLNQAGQGFSILHINETNPVSWPEIAVLQFLHGEESVFDIKPVKLTSTSPAAEKTRLAAKYTWGPVEQVFPGRSFRMEMTMPGESRDQERSDTDGIAIGTLDRNGNGEDDDEDENAKPLADPTKPPVFKPGRHPRPGSSEA